MLSNSSAVSSSVTHKERWVSPSPETSSLLSKQISKSSNYTSLELEIDNPDKLSTVGFSKKKLGLASLTVLIFYEVSGGPFGIEVYIYDVMIVISFTQDIVRAGGPFYALVGFLLLLVWALPEALITAELSTAMPEASGSVAWVDCAFGSFWAFQKGWLSWLSGVADNALYPILFLDCLIKLFASNEDYGAVGILRPSSVGGNDSYRFLFISFVTIILTYMNYRGLDVVGKVAIGICITSLLPFFVFCVVGSLKVEPNRWLVSH